MSNDLSEKFRDILAALSSLEASMSDVKSMMRSGKLGLLDHKPGRRVIYAHEKGGSLWHFWDSEAQEPILINRNYLRGWLRDVYMYTKQSEDYGTSEKVCAVIDTGGQEYILETGATSTTGRSLVASLSAADRSYFSDPITIHVSEGGEKENVVFLDMHAGGDLVITQSEDYPTKNGNSDRDHERCAKESRKKVQAFRRDLGWGPDDPYEASPFDGAVSRSKADSTQNGQPKKGGSGKPSQGGQQGPPPQQQGPPPQQQGESSQQGPPSGDGAPGSSGFTFNPNNPPPIDTEEGTISEEDATLLWNAASKCGGHDLDSFKHMLDLEFFVDTPRALTADVWEDAWYYADKEKWEEEKEERSEQTFEPDDEMPF